MKLQKKSLNPVSGTLHKTVLNSRYNSHKVQIHKRKNQCRQYKTGFISEEITIFWSGNKAEIKHAQDAKSFTEYIRARLTPILESAAPKTGSAAPTTNADDLISKLERLAALKNQEILTAEEFLEQKAKILGNQ